MLSECNVNNVCYALSYLEPWAVTITNNAIGCSMPIEVLDLCTSQLPANDECVNSEVVTLGEIVMASTDFSTESTSTPSCGGNFNRADVWYVFNSGLFTSIDIDITDGFSLQMWEGTCSSLSLVPNACGEDELTDIPVTTNLNYYLQIWRDFTETWAGRMTFGDFTLTVQEATLSNDKIYFENIKVFPNPVSNILSVEGVDNFDAKLEVLNTLGQTILLSHENEVDFSGFNSGIYYLKIILNNKRVIKRIVKN